jgi:hypothetical protein
MSLELAELNRLNMNNKKLIRFVESFLLLPVVMSTTLGNVPNKGPIATAPQIVLSQQMNMEANGLLAFNQAMSQSAESPSQEDKAKAIDSFFKEHNMPLEGTGLKMVQEAEVNDIDWRLLPAISVIESTGGRHACKRVTHRFMGWGSCKINFKSDEQAIEVVAKNLGGNNPNTDQHYADKTTEQILKKYNSVIPTYFQKVTKVMDEIEEYMPEVKTA